MKLRDLNDGEIQQMKWQAKTDLYFLAKELLLPNRFPGSVFNPEPHGRMCDFFVKKNPQHETFREFANSYQGPKDRMILVPRKSRKSTIKVIDNIQWMLCWPDISILVLTAERKLSGAFVDEFQSYLTVKGGERNKSGDIKGDKTLFQELFPQFCITEKEVVANEFISPARVNFSKEPTIGSLSIGSSGSGWSCDILDLDDVLSDDNTDTGEQLEKLENRIAMADNLKKKWGFRHIVGTRYNVSDAYGVIAERNGITELYGDFESIDIKYMCKPCWWLKGRPYEQPDYSKWKPAEQDVDLFFPEDLTFRVLSKQLREKPETFFSQQLNDPVGASGAVFTEEFVRKCFVDHTALPAAGRVYQFWDLAYGTRKYNDYRVGITALLDHWGRWWVTNITRGKYAPNELPFRIVEDVRVHRPVRTGIEDTMGAQWLLPEMNRWAKELGVELNLDWIPPNRGRGSEDAKRDRMESLQAPMAQKRLFFLNTIECMEDLIKEFRRVGNRKAKNDIPDAISRIVETYSNAANRNATPTPEQDARMFREVTQQEFNNMIFCRGKYEQQNPEPVVIPKNEPEEFYDPVTGMPC